MLDYLKTIFGSNISMIEYTLPGNTPMYIIDGYKVCLLSWNSNQCVLLSPNDSSWRLPTLKKQLKNFQKICDYPCALGLNNITSLQRRNLIENNIPFVSNSQQVYLPFWGTSFTEKFKTETRLPDKMAPGTQLVFLYLYYMQNSDKMNLTRIAKDLHISKATSSRAIDDLTDSKLILQQTDGRIKWITPAYSKNEFLMKGYARLSSPVERYIYVQSAAQMASFPKSGILALSDISMVGASEQDGAIAVSKKVASSIPSVNTISEEEFRDFGGFIIEVWNYDPVLFAHDGHVDEISLLLSLERNMNERVQMGLDLIRKKHDLPIEEDLW